MDLNDPYVPRVGSFLEFMSGMTWVSVRITEVNLDVDRPWVRFLYLPDEDSPSPQDGEEGRVFLTSFENLVWREMDPLKVLTYADSVDI